jgi:putative Mn2+ efflux pump MntP
MLLLAAVLVGALSNLDNLAVGVAFDMRNTRIAAAPNMIIAAVTMAGTAGAITSGHALSRLMPASIASALGSLIITAIGAWIILAQLHTRPALVSTRMPAPVYGPGDRTRSTVISYREAFALGIALALNNIASDVGAGAAGIPPITTSLLAGAFSLLCVGAESKAGCSASHQLSGTRASLAAGLVLLTVGGAVLAGAG